ncbi:SWIM zinc finger family protein [Nocardia callitridis]|uniref:SWIM-type domain-containing protein n=1 Tax=Nocardia callitridis TaxID=648753 RepID=A0ABP9JQQ0_9NOCA
MTPWSEDQVTALAPDIASVSAARKITSRWRETGQHGSALWGLHQRGGPSPYQTIVDLDGPAYKCSCPSRKFPCKHALSLLLVWSSGQIQQVAETPDFASGWLAGRAQRAAKQSAAPAEQAASRSANPATAQQRRVRVTAGLAELEVWLGDQIRTGLAQVDRSFEAFDAIAARMVDAQAPGIASMLRELPHAVFTRADWPEIVLREYARAHLLIAAHRRVDDVSPAVRASIRAHVGYQVTIEQVRAEPGVRDHWMVLAVRTAEQERLFTRRTWLLGRTSGRWALVLEHSFGSPSFPGETTPPGLLVDAELHFYPGAAPLRAVWGERHGGPEPFTTLPSSPDRPGTLAAAATDHASALGADPWLRSWPVLLTAVVPSVVDNRWYLVESDATALPIAPCSRPWRLLGVSGGHPVTVLAEWTVDGLLPLAAHTSGEMIDIGPESSNDERGSTNSGAAQSPSHSAFSAGLGELAAVALLGTARRTLEDRQLAEPVGAAAGRLSTDPAARLLESAALQDLFSRGGAPTVTATAPKPAIDDQRRTLPRAASARLAGMLTQRSAFLPEWFEAAAPHDYRAPDALCAHLLAHAKKTTAVREPLLRLAGERGAWLAEQHPEWRTMLSHNTARPPDQRPDDVWQFGRPAERREWLAALRRTDPTRARAALAASWRTESGPLKAELLALLGPQLEPADEALAQTALGDRRADVRRTAAGLLSRLPDSAFAHRMRRRAEQWIRVERSRRHTELVVALPDPLDAEAARDGIGDHGVEFTYRWSGAPDRTAILLRQLVAATPLEHWTGLLGAPDRVVLATIDDRFRQPVFDGWMDATLAHRDSVWARALFDAGVPTDLAMLRRRELFGLLPTHDRTAHLLRLDGSWLSEIEALLPAMPHPWPQSLAHHLVSLLAERAKIAAHRPEAYGTTPNAHRSLLTAASQHLPVTTEDAVAAVARRCADPVWERAFDQLAHDLTHRSMMLEELQ